MSIITTRRFSLWWTLAKEWFTSKFNSISIDTTSLAKQGSDKSVSLTGVDTKLGDAMDALDGINNGDSSQVIIGQGVVENVEEINNKIGTPAEGQAVTLFEAIAPIFKEYNSSRLLLIDKMRAAGVDISTDASIAEVVDKLNDYTVLLQAGTTFSNDIETVGDAIFSPLEVETLKSNIASIPISFKNSNKIRSVTMPNVTAITDQFQNCKECNYFYFENLRTYINQGFSGTGKKIVFYAPKLDTIQALTFYDSSFTQGQGLLQYCNIGNAMLAGVPVQSFQGFPQSTRHLVWSGNLQYFNVASTQHPISLYDVSQRIDGVEISTSRNHSTWVPTKAMDANSNDLCNHDEWDDVNEPIEGFANNLEKFLWYFRNHFMISFSDMTGQSSPTLTLHSSVYDVVMAQSDISNYFTNRNWTVARG